MRSAFQFITAIFIISLSSMLNLHASDSKVKEPDFAAPRKTADTALKELNAALKSGDGQATVKSLIVYGLAQTAIDPDSATAVTNRMIEVADREKSAVTRSLLNTLIAEVYNQVYSSRRHIYNERRLPLEPLPASLTEWSGAQFRDQISHRLNMAMEPEAALLAAPLSSYTDIIIADDLTRQYYPTLYDFITSRAINILSNIDPADYRVNASWLAPSAEFVGMSTQPLSGRMADIIGIFQRVISSSASRPGVLTQWDNRRLEFINNHLRNGVAQSAYIDALNALIAANSGQAYAGIPIAALGPLMSSIDQRKKYVGFARKYLNEFPDFFTSPTISNLVNNMVSESISVEGPEVTSPGYPTTITVTSHNCAKARLDIYLLPKTRNQSLSAEHLKSGTLINSLPLRFVGTAPFKEDTTLAVTLPRYGEYAIVPVIDDETKSSYINTIVATDLSIASISGPEYAEAIVTNPVTGYPVSGAVISAVSDNNAKRKIGKTDNDGLLSLPREGRNSNRYDVTRDSDTFAPGLYIWSQSKPHDRDAAMVLTDLSLYHPGDSINAAVIFYRQTDKGNRVICDSRRQLVLRDANYQIVDSVSVTTDQWGRASATLAIPRVCLNGVFTIEAMESVVSVASTSVMVSDYKMPTMLIDVNKPSVKPDEPVTVSGKVATYTGFPLADAEVSLTLSNAAPMRWRFFNANSEDFYSVTTKTDANGDFSIVIPEDVISAAPMPEAVFRCAITATDASGESQSASTWFVYKPAYQVEISCEENIDAATPMLIKAKVVGNDDSEINVPLEITIREGHEANGAIVARMPLPTDGKISLTPYKSGAYTIEAAPADSTPNILADSARIILYRLNDAHSPSSSLLWAPHTSVRVKDASAAVLHYEVSVPNVKALCVITCGDAVISKEWMDTHEGMNAIRVELPDGQVETKVYLFAARHLRSETLSFSVINEKHDRRLKLNIETFRDKTTPGAEETLTLRLTDNDGKPACGAVMVDMWNKALDAIFPHDFRFSPTMLYITSFDISCHLNQRFRNYASIPGKSVAENLLLPPAFNFYSRNFGGSAYRYATYGMNMVLMKASRANAPAATTRGYGDEVAVEEAAFDSAATMTTADSAAAVGASPDNGAAQSQDPYRDAETPLALWRPALTTDADGHLSIKYTLPNANATWVMAAIAYNEETLHSNQEAEQIASKPVMVQPNRPRFLRMGDRAVITARVMNATNEPRQVTTRFEIFDPATGAILASTDSADTYPAMGSGVVSVTVDTPFDTTMLGYRVLSTSGDYTDGERALIPVLESVTPVIESDNFYMAPSESTISRKLPAKADGLQVTLQFCQNPTWYVVTALPGLRANVTRTTNSAQAAIFSAAVADGLLRDHPDIKNALHRWLNSDRSDSTLVSMLERDQDLKIALLEASPWTLDARGDTERMQRLALLFDKREIEHVYATNIDALAKTQCHGGGWSWTPDYKLPSFWVTLNALEGFGRLRSMGYLPSDPKLKSMIKNAIEYADREAADLYRQFPGNDFTYYVAVRDMFADIKQSTAAAKVTDVTIKRMLDDWTDYDIPSKGIAAVILNHHGYAATARNIMASVREFATSTPQKGMWWPSLNHLTYSRYSKLAAAAIMLEAFAEVEPNSPDIDLIRQWIVLQKESQDWKNGVVTTSIIAAMLNSGSKWTVNPKGIDIIVNGEEFAPSSMTAATGYFRDNITALMTDGPGQLLIARRGSYPSWGSVITRQPMKMSEVEAVPCDGLSIEKTLYVADGDKTRAFDPDVDPLSVGDRVRVDLLVKADKDIDYVAIIDQRAACLEPVEQIPLPIWEQGLCFHRENRDSATNIYIDRLPAGTYRLSYELYVNAAGAYSSGVASIQSQYAPALTAHSSGSILMVK